MVITLKVSPNTRKKMVEYYQDKKRPKTPPYAVFQANDADTVITLYESGKAVFQGISADIDANIWKETEKMLNPTKKIEYTNSEKKKEKEKKISHHLEVYHATTLGSDEVGTGDYFGPIVVTACYVQKEDIPFLESLGVKDSKKLTDEKIIQIVPEIVQRIPYKSTIVYNQEYNKGYQTNLNLNSMKAVLHNKMLSALLQEHAHYDYIVIDQFAEPKVYFRYLQQVPTVIKNITFLTKAEDQCLSVACASLISRYIFLKEWKKLEQKVNCKLPKGASNLVDETAIRLVKTYGVEILEEIAKLNFKNTDKIKLALKKEVTD